MWYSMTVYAETEEARQEIGDAIRKAANRVEGIDWDSWDEIEDEDTDAQPIRNADPDWEKLLGVQRHGESTEWRYK